MYKRISRFPMKLQLFAAEGAEGGENGAPGENKTPSVKDLMAEVARLQAETTRQKSAIDKLTKENGDLTKSYRSTLSAQEQAKLAADDAQKAQAEQLADLQKQIATFQAKERYMALGMDAKLAAETAAAEISGDMAKVTENYQKHLAVVKEASVQEFLGNRNGVAAGHGSQKPGDKAIELAKSLGKTNHSLDENALSKWAH